MNGTEAFSPSDFFGPRALQAWSDAFVPSKGWHGPIRIVKNEWQVGAAPALAAFAWQRVVGFPVAGLAGYYWPYRTIALPSGEAGMAAVRTLAVQVHAMPPGNVLRLGPVSSADEGVRRFVSELRRLGWQGLRRPLGEVFGLSLPTDPADISRHASSDLLKNIAYCRRRLQKLKGELRVERHVLSSKSSDVLSALQRIESASWVASRGGDLKFVGKANEQFWNAMAASTGLNAEAVAWTLHCDDVPVAFSAHLETERTVYILANSFDEQWKRHSPGSIVTLEVLSDAIRRGKSTVDWGQGDSGYKSRWGAKTVATLSDLLLFCPSPLGSIMYGGARALLKDWVVLADV